MMRKSILIALILLLSGFASAWGPEVSKYVCNTAVERVWGESVLSDCIPKMDSGFLYAFCDVNAIVMGNDNFEKCTRAFTRDLGIHPALIPHEVFKDDALHYDYLHCPIIKGSDRWWICGDNTERPTIDLAEKWFSAAETAPDLCTRIYDFCVASNYYADSESELHQVKNFYNSCQQDIEAAADILVLNNLSSWSSGATCRFREGKGETFKDYKERLGVNKFDVDRALTYLENRGMVIANMSLHPKRSVIILANSIDSDRAADLYSFLKNNSIDVHFSTADNFEPVKYNPKIIILGGQNAVEGVGGIVSTILLSDEKNSLLEAGAKKLFLKENVWANNQNVVVVAGNEKEDTQAAWMENKERILSEVTIKD